ncbi:Retrovirus-related Pol polyprotein from type-2 retrotransposable element R2DM, partial [Diplonema papillatum]
MSYTTKKRITGVVLAATAAVATGVAVVMAAAAVAAAAAAGAAETTVAETEAAAAALVAAAHAAAHTVAVAAAAAVAVAARATASQAGSGARRPHRGHLPAVAGEGGRRNRPRSAPPRQQAGSDPRLAPPRPLPQPRCAHDDDAPISATTALASPARTHRAHPAPPGPLRWQALTRALLLILVPTLHGSHNDRALPPALPGYSRPPHRGKKTTACGVDGWRLDELKALPDELLDGFATLFNLVEERGEWPKGMLTSLVSLIPKTDDTSPTNLRPITVTSCVYRLWACRRLQDVMEWQDGWIHPSQHGFRRGHRTDDVLMELTTLIEETLLDESKSLYMVALDFAKCFDRVPQGIVLRLAEEMGLDARILRPLRAMYRGMKRRFKLPLGVGSEFEVTNGILQGCPLSVILINALLSIVLRAVSARVPEVSSESLADDATLFAAAEAELQRAVDIVARFCALTGMRLNMAKTLAMGIHAGSTQQRRRRPYASAVKVDGEAIATATAAKILGVRTSVESVQTGRANDARLSAHDGLIDRLGTSKLPFDVRCEVASSNVLSSVLTGCSYETYTQTRLKGLRTRIVRGAFGSKHPSRNVTAVLSILAKGHRLDPMIARPYRILCALFDTCERLPRVCARMRNIVRLYERHETFLPRARLGPVGIAIADGLSVAGIGFEGGDLCSAALGGRRLLGMQRGERHHVVRAQLRRKVWMQLARQRPSYDGVQAGVDCGRTNGLRLTAADGSVRRALTVILSG